MSGSAQTLELVSPAARVRALGAPLAFFVRGSLRSGWVKQHRDRLRFGYALTPLPARPDEFRAQGFVFAGSLT